MKSQCKHRSHLTATGQQNGLISLEHPDQDACGEGLKGITHCCKQCLCVEVTAAGKPRQPLADQPLLERHGWMQGTATDQCLNRQSQPCQDSQGCGGPAGNRFRKHQRPSQSSPETTTAMHQLLHPFELHGTAAGDALRGAGTWIFKAEMGEVRRNGQAESSDLRIETKLLADHPADQGG